MVQIASVEPDALAAAVIGQMGIREVLPYRKELETRFGWDGVAATYAGWLQQVVGSPATDTIRSDQANDK
jgi:hypothetical protein